LFKIRNDPERDLLHNADSFLKAANRCLNGCKVEPGIEMLTVPGVVCAVLASELYLKYIHLMESGSHPKGHDLEKLYADLNQSVRQLLSNSRPDIVSVLQRNRHHFSEARYHHEMSQFSFRELELLQLAECLSECIRARYNDKLDKEAPERPPR
jgi:HEPN domain-containing protein